jgi:SpoIID/LytB domain protein
MGRRVPLYGLGLTALASASWQPASAPAEPSPADQLDVLYSNRFSFTDRGQPRVTIEIMSGQGAVVLGSPRGVKLLPTGESGAAIDAGSWWTIEVEHATPAEVREWTVVEELGHDQSDALEAAEQRWRARGYQVQSFEVGAVFGVDGEVIDGRTLLVGIEPVADGQGAARARALAQRWNITTRVHPELVRRPRGTLVARSDRGAEVRHADILWFAPTEEHSTLEVKDVVHGGGGAQLDAERREHRAYWGSVYVTVDRTGALTVVNAIEADALLAGLVPAEIFPEAPGQALEAQAVAARTEVLSRIGTRHFADPYLLCSSQHCQVYAGAGREHPRTTRAVHETHGKVLLRADGGLVDARYSASCGGHSEHNEVIWGGAPDPTLRGHDDATQPAAMAAFETVTDANVEAFLALGRDAAYCGSNRYARGRYRWSTTVDARSLTARVTAEHRDIGELLALEPLERGVSGRIVRLRIRGTEGSIVAIGDLHIRRLLGGLKSSLFTVRAVGAPTPTGFAIVGAGFGHGVGMCQTGAIGRAESGQSRDAILNHYYPGSRTHRLY